MKNQTPRTLLIVVIILFAALSSFAQRVERTVTVEENGGTTAHAVGLMASATAASTRAASRPVMHR